MKFSTLKEIIKIDFRQYERINKPNNSFVTIFDLQVMWLKYGLISRLD